ncbi:uncharacterized protein LOC125607263 [Brassica napus]|uniref:uncharacterized protein LOC125607263 n=1 Tax=Brassica napus TaxID=3708 RepID=UPI0020791B95|nr:uncharacterized protein LOC125607263 [Brassica napus]
MNLVQGDRSVRDYDSEFTRLRRHVFDGREDEGTMIRNFMYGLKPELGSRLAGSNFYSLSDLVEKAVNVETVVEAERKATQNFGEHTKPNQREKQNFNKGQSFNKRREETFGGQSCYKGNSGICFSCGQQGHISRNCPSQRQSNQQGFSSLGRKDVICFTCGKKGHFATACSVNKPNPATPLAIGSHPSHPAIEPAPKRQNLGGRVYALEIENPDSTGPSKGPNAGTLHVVGKPKHVLFDSGETRRYVTPDEKEFVADLLIVPLEGYEVILGLDWL